MSVTALLMAAWLAAPPVEPASPAGPPPAAAPSAPAQDSPLTVTTRLTPDPSRIGDLLTLEVIVAYPRDHSINLPSGLELAPLELVDIEVGEPESTGEDLRRRFTLTLQQFEIGEAAVPSFPITWVDPSDEVHTYSVPPHRFVVESLLANESDPQPRGEDPPVSLEYPNERLALIIYSVLAGLVLAAMLAVLIVQLRRRQRPVPVEPPVPADERALSELATLAGEREGLIAAGRYQDYYLRLTQITKRYIGSRFHFEALDRTTEEIQDLLRGGRVELAPLDPEAVLRVLQDWDLVKFARLAPPDEETRAALELVRELVARSRVETPESAAPDGRPRATRPQPSTTRREADPSAAPAPPRGTAGDASTAAPPQPSPTPGEVSSAGPTVPPEAASDVSSAGPTVPPETASDVSSTAPATSPETAGDDDRAAPTGPAPAGPPGERLVTTDRGPAARERILPEPTPSQARAEPGPREDAGVERPGPAQPDAPPAAEPEASKREAAASDNPEADER